MSGLFSKPKTPAPPPKERPVDVDNLVAGTRQRVVKLPDGRDKVIIENIPLSPEEQRLADEYKRLEAQTVANIERLSNVELAIDIEEFQPAIQSVRETQEQALELERRRSTRLSEEGLAQRGLSDSTSATEVRSTRERAFADQAQTNERNLTLFAEQLRSDALARETNLFGLATGRSDVAIAQGLQGAQLGGSIGQSIFNSNINASNSAFRNQMLAFQAEQQARQQQLSSIGGAIKLGTLGLGAAGVFGGTAQTGAIGSIFGTAGGNTK